MNVRSQVSMVFPGSSPCKLNELLNVMRGGILICPDTTDMVTAVVEYTTGHTFIPVFIHSICCQLKFMTWPYTHLLLYLRKRAEKQTVEHCFGRRLVVTTGSQGSHRRRARALQLAVFAFETAACPRHDFYLTSICIKKPPDSSG